MHDTESILNGYGPISLSEMSEIRLMNRIDTKFLTTVPVLHRLLMMARDHYRVQVIDGRRIARYYTVYFDTPDRQMFVMHHNGHANRQKLRIRSYVDSAASFLEVKTKNNRGRTRKKRVPVPGFDPLCPDYGIALRADSPSAAERRLFVAGNMAFSAASLTECLENSFNRITLVNNNRTERLTIDIGLRFNNLTNGTRLELAQLVIIELKRDGLTPSPVLEMLRELRLRPSGFSKYFMGAALTDPSLKQNLIKKKIGSLRRLVGAPR